MGLSALTRQRLFEEASAFIRYGNNTIVNYFNPDEVSDAYRVSARLIAGFEDRINRPGFTGTQTPAYELLSRNIEGGEMEYSFVGEVMDLVRKEVQGKYKDGKEVDIRSIPFQEFFRCLVKVLEDYQDEVIRRNYVELIKGEEFVEKNRPQTFLSYAYKNRGLTNALFFYFWINGGLLYVDWMWEGAQNDIAMAKMSINDAMLNSEQLLFLRTMQSEFRLKGNNASIRQWCAWEIGNFYSKNKDEKYYTSFYDTKPVANMMLDTFRPMLEVQGGRIVSNY